MGLDIKAFVTALEETVERIVGSRVQQEINVALFDRFKKRASEAVDDAIREAIKNKIEESIEIEVKVRLRG